MFRERLLARHVSPEGVVLYRITLASIERDRTEGRYPNLADSPTFTGIWAATSCRRARLPDQRAEARADADAALAGLETLMRVTGVRGLLARAIRRDAGRDTTGLSGEWHPGAPGFARYVFRGDVSQDQYANGLLPALFACRELFPDRTRRLALDFAEHLLTNELELVDVDGGRTRFGDLSPAAGFGLNSIAQLTGYVAFSLAAELDPDPRFAKQRDLLRDRYRVPARSRRTNLRVLGVTSHSNDMMAFHLLETAIGLARRQGDPALADFRHALHRAWLRVRGDQNAYLTGVFCGLEPAECDAARLAGIRQQLSSFPDSKRARPPHPALARIPLRLLPGRKWERLARDPVPIAIRPPRSFEWKSSPYRVRGGGVPGTSYTGLDYLAAYWRFRTLLGVHDARARRGAP